MSDSWKVASVPFVIWRRIGRTPGSEDCEEREGELALCMVCLFDHHSSTALSVWRIVASLAVKVRTLLPSLRRQEPVVDALVERKAHGSAVPIPVGTSDRVRPRLRSVGRAPAPSSSMSAISTSGSEVAAERASRPRPPRQLPSEHDDGCDEHECCQGGCDQPAQPRLTRLGA